jgi:hypothetical protein
MTYFYVCISIFGNTYNFFFLCLTRVRYQEIHTFSFGNTRKHQEIPTISGNTKNFRKYLEISGNTLKYQEIQGNTLPKT